MGYGSLLVAVTDGSTFMTSRFDIYSLRFSFFSETPPGEAEDLVLAFGTSKTCSIRDDLAATRPWHQPHCDRLAIAQSRFDRFDTDTCGEEAPAQDLLRPILSTFSPRIVPIVQPSSVSVMLHCFVSTIADSSIFFLSLCCGQVT
jgi:hypothetical protein